MNGGKKIECQQTLVLIIMFIHVRWLAIVTAVSLALLTCRCTFKFMGFFAWLCISWLCSLSCRCIWSLSECFERGLLAIWPMLPRELIFIWNPLSRRIEDFMSLWAGSLCVIGIAFHLKGWSNGQDWCEVVRLGLRTYTFHCWIYARHVTGVEVYHGQKHNWRFSRMVRLGEANG